MLCGGTGFGEPRLVEDKGGNGMAQAHFMLWPVRLPTHARPPLSRGSWDLPGLSSARSPATIQPPPRRHVLATARSRRGPDGAPASLNLDRPVVPIVRKAERDLLPGGVPNTPWRRLALELELAPTLADLQKLFRANRIKTGVWAPHHTTLVVARTAALLYPKAVAAAAGAGTLATAPPPIIKRDGAIILETLASTLTKESVRQVHGFHIARLLVVMAWMNLKLDATGDATSPRCATTFRMLLQELTRAHGLKLAQVAAADPPLFARLVCALAQLAPRDDYLWVELQRLALAQLLQAAAERRGGDAAAAGGRSVPRVWGASSSGEADAAVVEAEASTSATPVPGISKKWSKARAQAALGAGSKPLSKSDGVEDALHGALAGSSTPDCGTPDLANLAFGFAAANRALPPLFDALREAVLSRALPPDPDALASLLWSWARAQRPPGHLIHKVTEAFRPLLDRAPARALARLVWAQAALGMRNRAFLQMVAEAIVRRKIVFGSAQELINVCWAFGQLDYTVNEYGKPRGKGNVQEQEGAGEWAGSDDDGLLAVGGLSGTHLPDPTVGLKATGETLPGIPSSSGRGRAQRLRPSSTHQASPPSESLQRPELDAARASASLRAARSLSSTATASTSSLDDEPQHLHEDGAPAQPEDVRPPVQSAWEPPVAQPQAQLRPLASVLRPAEGSLRRIDPDDEAAGPMAPPDPSSPAALYRHLAHTWMNGQVQSNGKWAMSSSQLAVLAASFAHAGYGNKSLFYTIARMAMRRLATLSAKEVSMLLTALARVRVKHDALFQAGVVIIQDRAHSFNPAQLASALWAVQRMMPASTHTALVEALRSRVGWRQAAAWAAAGGVRDLGRAETVGFNGPVSMLRLSVPSHLLELEEDEEFEEWVDTGDEAEDGSLWHGRSAGVHAAEPWREGSWSEPDGADGVRDGARVGGQQDRQGGGARSPGSVVTLVGMQG